MKYLKIVNWQRFQHYKDRTPPWIKLHRDLLRNYEYECLDDEIKLLLVLLWLLASQVDNKIPNDLHYISKHIPFRKRITNRKIQQLVTSGFIEYSDDESETLADCNKPLQSCSIGETETETEAEKETEKETETDTTAPNEKDSFSAEGKPASLRGEEEENNLITFDFHTGLFEGTNGKKTQWAAAFPAVDIEGDIKRAAIWLMANPTKRKKNYERFLTNWFARSQEKGGCYERTNPANQNRIQTFDNASIDDKKPAKPFIR